jgi:hypothetical protein
VAEVRQITPTEEQKPREEALSGLIEYLSITGILVVMLIIIIFAVNLALIETPAKTLKYHSYVDVGNGVSARIVDLYVISPGNGTVSTKFDLPNDVAGQDYFVQLDPLLTGQDQMVIVTDGSVSSSIAIAGIGATKGVKGNTTGGGLNRIIYKSGGV